jgi:putative hydroxymethylpyrimidine transport system permease protein
MIFFRSIFVAASLLFIWQLLIWLLKLPPYILPSPAQTFIALYTNFNLIIQEAFFTISETLIGLLLGTLLGCSLALAMMLFRPLKFWLLPILIISQALPTFAIAPLLVIWFGYGMASKIITIMLMLFFPVASATFDGLRRTDQNWLDLAKVMHASAWRILWCIRVPAALPAFASGFRIATAAAPIGAIIGEWVGASHGLGFLMLNANARMQIDLMFATLLVIVVFGLGLYFFVDCLLKQFIYWQTE